MAAYYPDDQVEIIGTFSQFSRPTDLGGLFDQSFCPECGTTVILRGQKNPGMTGIPIGCFDDDHTMQPVRSVWEDRRHPWVEIPPALQHYPQGRTD